MRPQVFLDRVRFAESGTTFGTKSSATSRTFGGVSPTTLNAIGLTLNLVGALLMYFFGVPRFPQKDRAGHSYLLLESSGSDTKEISRVHRADLLAKLGGLLLVGGFAVQLIALWR